MLGRGRHITLRHGHHHFHHPPSESGGDGPTLPVTVSPRYRLGLRRRTLPFPRSPAGWAGLQRDSRVFGRRKRRNVSQRQFRCHHVWTRHHQGWRGWRNGHFKPGGHQLRRHLQRAPQHWRRRHLDRQPRCNLDVHRVVGSVQRHHSDLLGDHGRRPLQACASLRVAPWPSALSPSKFKPSSLTFDDVSFVSN